MTDLTIIDGTGAAVTAFVPGAALPAYMQKATEELGSNILSRISIPSVSYEGKVWQIVVGKDKQKLTERNSEGDIVARAVMRVVILGVAQRRGRSFYPSTYDPTKAAQPDCWSSDGVAPDENIKAPQSAVCQTCPKAAKGSKVTDGREGVACAQHRILAVVPGGDLGQDPLRLKIAITSDYDKDNTEHGWYAFQQYMDFLTSQNIAHSGQVVTKMRFDNNTAYPKILFGVDRFLSGAEYAQMLLAVKNPKVKEVISDKFTPAGVNGQVADQSDTAPQVLRGKPDDAAHVAREGTEDELWWDGANWVKPWLVAASPAPAPAPAPVTPTAKIAAAVVADMDKQEAAFSGGTAVAAKPSDPAFIARAGTEDELWWDGTSWLRPWIEAAPAPAPAPARAPVVEKVMARPAPVDPAHFHLKGTADEMWWDGMSEAWVKPWGLVTAAPATPAAPAAPETPINQAVASADPTLPADLTALMQKWN